MNLFLLTLIIMPYFFSAQTEKIHIFNSQSLPIHTQNITAITTDFSGLNWIGTKKGIAVFKDNDWKFFNKKNTPLKASIIRSLAYDDYDRI